jgi:hypothetical protein
MSKVSTDTEINPSPYRTSDNWLDVAIVALAILPLLLTKHLPLVDLPNHLARQYILRDLTNSPVLQNIYEVRWALVPNLALELFVSAAGYAMSIDMAVRLFCIVTILLLFIGTRSMNRALAGEKSRIYRFVPFLCYGGPFQWGFLSFCFGIGLAIVLFGLYLRLRGGTFARLMAIMLPSTFALLLCHLAAFGVFAIAMGSFELERTFKETGWSRKFLVRTTLAQARILAFLAPPFLLFALFGPVSTTDNVMRFSTIHEKLESIVALTMFSSPVTELPLLFCAIVALAVAFLCKTVRLHHSGFVMAAGLGLIWLALPRVALSGGYIDYRVPWAASFFLLAAITPASRHHRLALPLTLAFGALVLLRIGLIAGFWLSWEPTLASIDNALAKLPQGAKVMVVEGDTGSTSLNRRPALDHVAAYAVARREAFETSIFAGFSGQILSLREPYKQMRRLTNLKDLDQLIPGYNFVLVLRPTQTRISPTLPLRCQDSGQEFRLFAIVAANRDLKAQDQRGRCSTSPL